jgi:hypothetical protein
VLAMGEDTELKAQGGGGRGHHAGKLAAANNTDYRKSHKPQPTENLTGTRLFGLAGARTGRRGGSGDRPGTARRRVRSEPSHRPGRADSRETTLKWAFGPNGRQFQKATEGHDYYT